jgi:hypothetical protein
MSRETDLAALLRLEVTPPDYAGAWFWCGERFPDNPELAEACRWGAFQMAPNQPTAEWRA